MANRREPCKLQSDAHRIQNIVQFALSRRLHLAFCTRNRGLSASRLLTRLTFSNPCPIDSARQMAVHGAFAGLSKVTPRNPIHSFPIVPQPWHTARYRRQHRP